jgi:hypothetical protein
MVKSKAIRLDPQAIKSVMDIDHHSALNTTLKKPKKVNKKSDKDKLIEKSALLTKEPKHTLRSPVSMESDSSSSENSNSEMTSTWADNKTPPYTGKHKQSEPYRAKSASPVICPSDNQNVTVAADIHCS